ncbi:hypothetical protein IQ264_30870 [Phormidium sp. LEGE 05292]|uniref:hypothetical protein n=1 Tax=[Phormidium] sp. LEGE 05292 TaxID=767427 RepID=UPI00187FA9AD|nr:hypothetical protein [Phormidium sp. LEGE 05292]MBE9229810.1 hypothetical protein [Phormidium sp. LEGE 05292]
MIRNHKKYSIDINKVGQNIAINISLEMELSPDLAELVLRDLSTDIKDFNEARILAEIVRDPIIIYSICQRLEEVKNQELRYPELQPEMRHRDSRNEQLSEWSLDTTT